MFLIRILLIVFCVFNFGLASGQSNDSMSNLGYANIQDGRLQFAIELKPNGRKTMLKSINLLEGEQYSRLTTLFNPDNWKTEGDILCRANINRRKKKNALDIELADLYIYKLQEVDSLQRIIAIKKASKDFLKKYGHLEKRERIRKSIELDTMNKYDLNSIPIFRALSIQNIKDNENIYDNNTRTVNDIFLDFFVTDLGERKFKFFFRFKNFFTVWEFKPFSSIDSNSNREKEWIELGTYSSGEFIPIPKGSVKNYYPSGKEEYTKYEAVEDNAFFEGEFKVINQGKNLFVINTYHGAIYHIGTEKISKVGQVNLENYKRKIEGKTLFIEDKDEEEVIFFAPVKMIPSKANAPYLKTKIILEDSEFNRIFKNL